MIKLFHHYPVRGNLGTVPGTTLDHSHKLLGGSKRKEKNPRHQLARQHSNALITVFRVSRCRYGHHVVQAAGHCQY